MSLRPLSLDHFFKAMSPFIVAAVFAAAVVLVLAPVNSSQQFAPPSWTVQSTDPAQSLLTLKGSVRVGVDTGMFYVVQFRIQGNGVNQLSSFQPNMVVVLESSGPKLQPLTTPPAKAAGKAQPQTSAVAKSPTASTAFTGIPTAGQTLLIQASGMSPLQGVVVSVTGPQSYGAGQPGPPCCTITAINYQASFQAWIASAKANNSTQTFEFAAPVHWTEAGTSTPAAQVGQSVWANLTTGQVSLDGKTPCCQIIAEGISSSGPGGKPTALGVKNPVVTSPACCEITAINQQAKTASAKVKASGQTFQIAVASPMLFQSLRVGQAIWANFTTGEVSLDGRRACCAIASVANLVPQSGWIRYGKVAGTFPGGIRLVPLTSVLHSRVPADSSALRLVQGSTANGVINFPAPVNAPGQIKGTTRVWTAEALRGFEGSVMVFLLDENGQPVFQTSERHWGVNGQAIPGAPSDRTEDWAEPVPADAMALARKIVMVQRDYPVSKWEDTLIQAATDLGYVILGIGCLLIGNELVIGTDGVSCQPPSGGDSTNSSQAVATGASMIFSRPVPLQSPQSGQMVWVNLETKQALWTAFPITAHQQDDLGNSHYMDTSVTVFYPPVAQPGTSPRAAGGSTLQAGPVVPTAGTSAACCVITRIDAAAGLATAKENSGGQSFEFSVPSAVSIQNLHAGQPVWANFKARQVSLDGKIACCSIVSGPFAQSPGVPGLGQVSAGKTPDASAPGARPDIVQVKLGGLWVPLGMVDSVGPNQLSIRTVVSTQKGSGGAARESSRASTPPPAPPEGPMVVVGVEMASEPSSSKSGVAARENVTAGGAGPQSPAGQNTASPGGVMARESGIMLKPVPPLPGQMVWVNRTTRQVRWVNFPLSMTREDDLGDSHHLKTQINVSLPGPGGQALIKGETRLWTFRELGGFKGRVWVTFTDDMNQPLFIASRPRLNYPGEVDSWHVCGHSEFWCGDSDVTRDWGESVPADDLLRAAKVSIKHGAEDTLGADLLKIICDVVPCSAGSCSHPPSAQTPPSPHAGDPCGPATGTN